MSDNNVTVHQFEPLRVPSKWSPEERKLVLQIEDLLIDLYKRFNRIRVKDLSKKTVQYMHDSIMIPVESKFDDVNESIQTYQEHVSQEIVTTATEVVQNFQYDSLIQALQEENAALKNYKIETEQYTKSGLLYYDSDNVPHYGYAVGEVLTRVEVNGEETVQRENLLATFESGRLNFWQGGEVVAYYANKKLYVLTGEFLDSVIIGDWTITGNGHFKIKYSGA